MLFPVICPIEFSLLEIGKVKWLEKCTKSNMKVVLVSGEMSSNTQEESLIYPPLDFPPPSSFADGKNSRLNNN
jgi:hypothetical protein